MSSRFKLALLYVGFAIVATACNLLSQRLVMAVDDSAIGFIAALVIGTGVGLVVKYLLDKRWIFADTSQGLANHSRKFSLYALMGVFTTAIFWGTETAAWLIWNSHLAREAGALVGLAIGYVVKYHLDKRFVFARADEGLRSAP